MGSASSSESRECVEDASKVMSSTTMVSTSTSVDHSHVLELGNDARDIIRHCQNYMRAICNQCTATVNAVETQRAAVRVLLEGSDLTAAKDSARSKAKGKSPRASTRNSDQEIPPAIQDMLIQSQSTTSASANCLKESLANFKDYTDGIASKIETSIPLLKSIQDRQVLNRNGSSRSSETGKVDKQNVKNDEENKALKDENVRLKMQLENAEKESIQLKTQLENAQKECTKLTGKLDSVMREDAQLKTTIETMKETQENTERHVEHLRTEVENFQSEKEREIAEKQDLVEQIKTLEQGMEYLQKDLNAGKESGQYKEECIGSLQHKIDELNREVANKGQALEESVEKQLILETKNDNLLTLNERLQTENDENRKQLTQEVDKCKKLTIHLSSLNQEIDTLKSSSRRTITDLKNLKDELSAEKRQVSNKERELEAIRRQLDMASSENQKCYARIQEFERKANRKRVTYQLYCPSKTTITDQAEDELTTCLKIQFDIDDIDATAINLSSVGKINPGRPLVVICINASRLGSDVENGLKGLYEVMSWNNIACVILHHREIHALPSQPSSRLLTAAQYRSLGAIIDIAFLKDKGMYSCDMNNKALADLVEFIKAREGIVS